MVVNAMDTTQALQKVKDLLVPFLKERDVVLVDLSLKNKGGVLNLVLLADKSGGISISECAQLNTDIGNLLDKEEVIDKHYVLEVSSPGLDRLLVSDMDFKRTQGNLVRIVTSENIAGTNVLVGILRDFDSENLNIALKNKDEELIVPRKIIAKAKREVTF